MALILKLLVSLAKKRSHYEYRKQNDNTAFTYWITSIEQVKLMFEGFCFFVKVSILFFVLVYELVFLIKWERILRWCFRIHHSTRNYGLRGHLVSKSDFLDTSLMTTGKRSQLHASEKKYKIRSVPLKKACSKLDLPSWHSLGMALIPYGLPNIPKI